MRKSKIIFLILNTIIAIVLSLCFVYTKIQIVNARPPYKLSPNAVSFSIFTDGSIYIDKNNELKAINIFHSILKDKGIVLISENIDNPGLGIFDPIGYYDSYNLVKGSYLDKTKHNIGLVKNNSYVYNTLGEHNTFNSIGNQTFSVVGIYNENYPLYNVEKEYVYNFFDEPSLFSYYYVDHKDKTLLDKTLSNEIIPLLKKYNYIVKIERNYDNSYKSILMSLLSNRIYCFSIIVLLFMYINLFLYYISTTLRWKRIINIHLMLGANRSKLTHYISIEFLMSIILGSLIGGLIYYIIFDNSFEKITITLSLFSFIVNVVISYILFVISVFINSSFRSKDGEKL